MSWVQRIREWIKEYFSHDERLRRLEEKAEIEEHKARLEQARAKTSQARTKRYKADRGRKTEAESLFGIGRESGRRQGRPAWEPTTLKKRRR